MAYFVRVTAFLRGRGLCAIGAVALCSAPAADGVAELAPGLTGLPLTARNAGPGATLFTDVPPEQTGIVTSNAYDDPRMWTERYHEFGVGAIGTGVAVGDYDNDGRPDLFVVSKVETCRLFRNLGGWRFEDVTEKAGVGDSSREWKQGASFVDVNNDGRLDLYLCRFAAPNLLFINQGDGTFREEAQLRGLAVVDASGMAAFADYDRDGWLDLYLQTNLLNSSSGPDGQPDYLFHNNGDGTFSNVTAQAGIAGPTQGHSATWWDVDEDGWLDIYVANDFGTPDYLYRNNNDGTFANVGGLFVPRTPVSSMGADLGDVTNDGRIDFFVADMAATTHEKDQRGMADTRGTAKDVAPGRPSVARQVYHNTLYINSGTGHYLEGAFLAGVAATDWTWAVRLEDLDNDGRLDLYVTNGMNREQTNTDFLTATMRAESATERARLMRTAPILSERNLAFRNKGDLAFEDVSAAWGLDRLGVSFGAAFGDFDGDGDLDLVHTNYQNGVTVLRNDGVSGHRVVVVLRGKESNRFGVGATVRLETESGVQVRQLVLARGYLSTSEPVLHFGLGADTRIQRLSVTWPNGKTQEFADGLPVDMAFTITESDSSSPALTGDARELVPQFREVSENIGLAVESREEVLEGTVSQPLLPMRFNRRGPGLAVGDLDGDGEDEIVVGGTTQAPVRVLHRGDGAASFAPVAIGALSEAQPINDGPALVLDVNGDGFSDLLLTAGGAALPAEEPEYEPRLYLKDGHGGWVRSPEDALPSLPASVGALAAADFNRDGVLDVFVGGRVFPGFYPEAPTSALWLNRDGRLVDATDELAPELRQIGLVTSALWSDVDGDGWMDLVVALEWGGVRYLHNEKGQRLVARTDAGFASAGLGWWNSLASADFNGDGRPDFVTGNLGLNTAFRATPDRPVLLFYSDFAETGTPQLIDAYYEGDRLVPRRSRRELGAAIPSILKRFPKNDQYASATLEQIIGQTKLAAAQRFVATELRSGVLLSQANGAYRFEPLPRIAQIAPVQGLVAGDFDGDGKADIYAVQNSHAPAPVFGRFEGGLSQLLRGDGAGNFAAVPAWESGLVVPGDGKALAVVDLNRDGWPDFLVTRNNSTSLAFQNQGMPARHMFRVRLNGPKGNPTAVGARVTVEMADGSTQMGEVQAGSGWASQSSPYLFFGHEAKNPVRKATVRWTTGLTTLHDVDASAATLVLLAPERVNHFER